MNYHSECAVGCDRGEYLDRIAELEAKLARLESNRQTIAKHFSGYAGYIPPEVRQAALEGETQKSPPERAE